MAGFTAGQLMLTVTTKGKVGPQGPATRLISRHPPEAAPGFIFPPRSK